MQVLRKEDIPGKCVMGNKPAKVIAVTSGKGGVGKTHTCVNLGLSLVQKGRRVLLLDADLGLANINIMLGFKPSATLFDVLNGGASIKDVIVSHESGFDVIPAASGVPELTRLSEQDRMTFISAVESLGTQYDYMFVDTAAGIGDNVTHFCVAAEQILVVIDREPTSVTDAYALVKLLTTRHGIKEVSIVANRTPIGSDGRNTYSKLAKATGQFLDVGMEFLGSITDDDSVPEAVIAQSPFLNMFPSCRASRDIGRLADNLINDEGRRNPAGGIQFFFEGLLKQS